ncbi:MAG: hypothetical protein A3F33_01630 [Candidatus Woykebacteria bacterium RIFCSPHIGHO2_12_FULL_43_10]|uniref:N-acetyltransferase domain-containing protein n=2 Tax=Candidatus Woykeibacteriota TaxID=1817899 RepID=A0A1G1WW98_9BACT|nr:MAG: hypothetical protein A2802_01830 [Candidatus Woykebacteria bacterium RIFCSPHIGHO2_01_FULL_43_29]OGY29516.1 MAG: hypothetical protein A3F33_01630 [Candidatus Woykebacteria bacterium RIFCSPHIGHO2_12_FULL_43_10]OGY29615.1 MAG: hypothetical protein A3J50_00170 [Candidatus Woykebacteria bacterium RIFCSPHIGHO2_02_FULL_43_16b]OGY31630.1 MAG: hypothetical protein A3A61_00360 [Candidatus Woykebacteria bacterium RIFCSPLOWO2_01_FULL_43_14]
MQFPISNSQFSKKSLEIVELAKVPEEFLGSRKEANLLEYVNSRILVSLGGGSVVGSVRIAEQVGSPIKGLITDLMVDKSHGQNGVEEELIKSAEKKLGELGVKEIDGLCLDGVSQVRYYYRLGFKPFRRTVSITWDLTKESVKEVNPEYEMREFQEFKEEFAEVIVNSLQPYWTPWKEGADKKNQEARIKKQLEELFVDKSYRVFAAFQDGQMVGLVDACLSEPNLVFGVCVRRDFGGRKLGSTLLKASLSYLREQGLKMAKTLATSGLDDYDPQIYLYTLSAGGKMEKEYIDLRKEI